MPAGIRRAERSGLPHEHLLSAVLLVSVGLIVYANSWQVPLVFDGDAEILNNKTVHQLWPLSGPMGGTTRPIVYLTFALNYACGGARVAGYHAVNIAIHIAAALALWGVLARSLRLPRLISSFGGAGPRLALIAALIWMVHPLQTQSVTYVYQRLESLMALCVLLTLYCFIRGAAGTGRTALWQIASVGWCLIAMGSKEVAAAAPILVLLYDRIFLAADWREIFTRRKWYYLALGGTYLWLACLLWQFSPKLEEYGQVFVKGVTPLDYALSQPGVVLHYLRLVLWPVGLCLDYAWPVARTAGEIVPAAVVIGSLLLATGVALLRRPTAGYLGLWFFLILAPTSSVMPIRDLAFEHRMYLPLAAIVVGVIFGGYRLARRLEHARSLSDNGLAEEGSPILLPGHRKTGTVPGSSRASRALALVGIPAIGVAVVLGALTLSRNHDYRTSMSIWEDTVHKRPLNSNAHCNYGVEFVRAGKLRPAFDELQTALSINPENALAHHNLASVYGDRAAIVVRQGQRQDTYDEDPKLRSELESLTYEELTQRALEHFRTSVKLRPGYAPAHSGLASMLVLSNELPQAFDHFRESLRLDPDLFQAHRNLALLLCRSGQLDEGIDHLRRALEIQPDDEIARRSFQAAVARRRRYQ